MKKILILLCFLLVSSGYSQKKELRSANKFIEKGEYTSALDILESISDILQTADDKTKARSMFLYGMIYTNTEDFDKAVESYQVAKDIGGSNPLLDAEIAKLENAIITSAIGDQENENFISSAKKLYGAYKINPENKIENFWLNSNTSVNVTSNWKLNYNARFNLIDKNIVRHNLTLYREIDCWELFVDWTPNGYAKGLYFRLNLKSDILRDLKVEQKTGIYTTRSSF